MNLNDIFSNRLDESFNKPYPIHKRSPTTYDIDAEHGNVRVFLNGMQIEGVNCLSLKFVNPEDAVNALSASNVHGNSALRVFVTLITLVDPIKFNLLLCVADDVNVNVEDKKSNLYMVVLRKLERQGKIHSVQSVNIEQFDKPVITAQRGVALTEEQIQTVVIEFVKSHI